MLAYVGQGRVGTGLRAGSRRPGVGEALSDWDFAERGRGEVLLSGQRTFRARTVGTADKGYDVGADRNCRRATVQDVTPHYFRRRFSSASTARTHVAFGLSIRRSLPSTDTRGIGSSEWMPQDRRRPN